MSGGAGLAEPVGVLFAGSGMVWPWLGLGAWGLAAALTLARASGMRWPWPLAGGVPLGVIVYTLVLMPFLAMTPAGVAVPLAALVGAGALGGVAWQRCGDGRRARARPVGGAKCRGGRVLADWLAFGALAALAGITATGAARYAAAALLATELPPLLTGSSTGDWGLHALRVALVAQHGIPPPSPLDPDFPLQYRYVFHVLAAAFVAEARSDYGLVTGAVSGLVLGAVVFAGAALGYSLTRSRTVALAAGVLGALYGPSYWVSEVGGLIAAGRVPDVAALLAVASERWPLSPLAPSFPSLLTAQGSSPGLPIGVLAWLAVLLCLTAPRSRVLAGVGGASLAVVAFGADYFLPVAAAALGAGGGVAWRWARVAPLPAAPRWRDWLPTLGAAGLGLLIGLLSLFGAARQVGGAGAAGSVRLLWNEALGQTSVYGGNHAILAGGQTLRFPNWVGLHDWGILFWPGVVVVLGGALKRREPVLFAGGVAAVLTALIWHLLTVAYDSPIPVNYRVQMYRYASMATAVAAPLVPIGLAVVLEGVAGLGLWWRLVRGALQAAVLVVGAGAAAYLLAAVLSLPLAPPPELAGDVDVARRLAAEPGPKRLAVLNGPESFAEMYSTVSGGYLPLWWGWGGAAVPVGWDFGHPERYGPPYREVVRRYSPRAAVTLGLTHVAVAPGQVAEGERASLQAFLRRCDAVLLASWGEPEAQTARRLYRIRREACASEPPD